MTSLRHKLRHRDAVNHACALMQNARDKSSAGPRISVLSNNPVTLKVITWHAHDVYEETKNKKLWLSFAQCFFLCSLYLHELVIIDLKLLETHVKVRLLVLHMCRETGSVGVYPRDFVSLSLKNLGACVRCLSSTTSLLWSLYRFNRAAHCVRARNMLS